MSARVIIIGGGVMGCAIAFRLAQRGFAPLVIERAIPGAEAASAAGGIIAPQKEAEGPGPLLDLGLRSRAAFPALAEELRRLTGLDIGYRPSGLLALATAADAPLLEERAAWQSAMGLRVELLGPAELRRQEGALGEFPLALRLPDEAQVDPPLLVKALQFAAARAGAVFRAAYVRRVLHDGQQVRGVDVEGETLPAEAVVVAAGSWSALVEGAALPAFAVRPMRGQMVELLTRPPLLSHIVFAPGGYLVPRPDGRLLVGSTMELVGFRKEVTAAGLERLLALAQRVAPALADAQVGRFWAGFRPFTEDRLPILGPTAIAGLHLATGHFRNGILLTPISAEAIAAVVAGDPSPVDLTPFSVNRLS